MPATEELLRASARIGTGPVSDAMEGLGLRSAAITGLRLVSSKPGEAVVGPAYTIRQATKSRAIAHDENLTRQRDASSSLASAGQVIVIDANGRTDICTWGENQALKCLSRGIAGLVVHGAIRDSQAILESGFPVLCRGFSPVSSKWYWETVAMNEPITIDGVEVRPHDIIYGDPDGVLVIPADRAEEVLTEALRICEQETKTREQLYPEQV